MKILKNPTVISLLIIMVMGTIGFFSYKTYLLYQQYSSTPKSTSLSTFLDEIISVLDKIDDERIYTVDYMQAYAKSDFKQMSTARDVVDNALMQLTTFIKERETLRLYSAQIKEVYRALCHVRGEVDSFKNDYKAIFFHDYHGRVFTLFSNIISEIAVNQDSEVLNRYLLMYEKIIALKENVVLENTWVYFTLLNNRPMDDNERVIFNQTIAKDKLPEFGTLSDSSVEIDLLTLDAEEKYNQILSQERQQIMDDSNSGKYNVEIVAWLNKIDQKMDYFKKAESILHAHIEQISQNSTSQSKVILFACGAGVLVLLMLLFKLFSIRLKVAKNRNLDEDTLRDIELVFDKNQQKKLKRLIENGNINFIYKFMIQAIQDANQTKDLFLASMSHEIRTPLNGILGFTQLLKESEMTEEQHEMLLVVKKSSDHLLNIVNDILDLSKIKAHKIELENIEFDPITHFESAVESYTAKAEENNIEFTIFLDPKLPTLLMGDPTKISQVIVNLISNAIKFTPKNGEVNVSLERLFENDDEVEVKFSVSDTGIGITKEQRKNIFEAFSQADVSTSRKYGGTGLGLSISGKLIDHMGGELKIRSVENEGSTFYFTLIIKKSKKAKQRVVEDMSAYTVGILDPHIEEEYFINKGMEAYLAYTGAKIEHYTDEKLLSLKGTSQLPDILFIDHKFRHRGVELEQFLDFDTKVILISTGDQKRNLKRYQSRIRKIIYKPITFTKTIKAISGKADSVEQRKQIKFENIHVLVAEDNRINQQLIINVLNRIGIEVSIANNGQEAVECYMRESYDMVLMDIEMPVMGGIEATAKILSFERHNGKAHTPIVALTANIISGNSAMYLGVGMDHYLSKPMNLDAIREIFVEYFHERIVEDAEEGN